MVMMSIGVLIQNFLFIYSFIASNRTSFLIVIRNQQQKGKMKKLKSSLFSAIALLAVLFFAASCSNTNDPTLLTDKTWVIESVNMAGMDMTPAQILTDEGAEYQMTLKADGTLVFADNTGMNPMSGKWVMQKNNTQFMVSGIEAGKSDVNTITKLTATELWFWHMDGSDKMIMHYKVK
jgi:hypothetical protein